MGYDQGGEDNKGKGEEDNQEGFEEGGKLGGGNALSRGRMF